jgi:GNAT superfamily N-acetyltransferase
MRPGEERAAYKVVEDAFSEWPDRTHRTFEDWDAGVTQRPGFEPWHLRLVVDPGGAVVGVAYVFRSRESAFIPYLAVRKDQRRQGLARALLVDAFAAGREHGVSRLELSTDSRTGALGLYERVGMEVISTWLHRAVAV